jgi:SAM-dependent methyltransferase
MSGLEEHTISDLWSVEYEKKGIPSSFREKPSQAVQYLHDYLLKRKINEGNVVDLGCGKGRNTLFFANQGFIVYAIDYLKEVVEEIQRKSEEQGIEEKVTAFCRSVTEELPFENETIDIAFDTFCYKHQIFTEQKDIYRRELARVLKPKGIYLLTLASVDDGYYGPLLSKSPVPQKKVIIDPTNGIASMLYSKEDIIAEFEDNFNLVDYNISTHLGAMHDNLYKRRTHRFIFERRVYI